MALLYTSAVANTTYLQLSAEVEHIFIKGQLYKLESYAYGISTPISVADDFFDVLLRWNVATQDTVGEASGSEVKQPMTEVNRVIQSDNPIQGIWIRLRQLHSVALAHKTIGRRVNAVKATVHADSLRTKAEGVSFAVRNATDYFRMREEQGVSQRVLNLYYGTLSFAFAEMLAHPDGPATLAEIEEVTKQGHGLYTVDAPGGGIRRPDYWRDCFRIFPTMDGISRVLNRSVANEETARACGPRESARSNLRLDGTTLRACTGHR